MLKLNRVKFVEIARELIEANASNLAISDILIDMECLESIPEKIYCFKTGSESSQDRIDYRLKYQKPLLIINGTDLFECL